MDRCRATAPQSTAEPGEPAADRKCQCKDKLRIEPAGVRNASVVDTGADHSAEPRAFEAEDKHECKECADHNQKNPVTLQR